MDQSIEVAAGAIFRGIDLLWLLVLYVLPLWLVPALIYGIIKNNRNIIIVSSVALVLVGAWHLPEYI